MSGQSLYWHDYETFGINPASDRPAQFAGVRTDADFNIIAEPDVFYCRQALDSLPHPDACLITGITPQLANAKGVCEAEFFARIHQQLSRPQTCTLGYNNIRFDDEVTRIGLYRNFYDPYAREWQNGNSRWDLLDVIRAAHALRPGGISWPQAEVEDENGVVSQRPSFRLDQLTVANGITHEAAHDALSDVYATIGMAKLLKQAQPKLYEFLWSHRLKAEALQLLQLGSFKPVVHVSGKYPAAKNCLAVVLPVCKHPTNPNGVMVYDLASDPEAMLSLPAEAIRERIFTAKKDLPEGIERIPLKTVHINKCPVLAPINVLKPEDLERLHIDLSQCQAHINKIKAASGLAEKLAEVFSPPANRTETLDPDFGIYSGGFFSDSDKQKMAKIRSQTPAQLAKAHINFNDARLDDMLFRYRARNFPETLNPAEQQEWHGFCAKRLTGEILGAGITFADYFDRCQELRQTNLEGNSELLDALESYGLARQRELTI